MPRGRSAGPPALSSANELDPLAIQEASLAPAAFFSFSGWKESFFGDLHAQRKDSIEF